MDRAHPPKTHFARSLRQNAPPAEQVLWLRLRNRQLNGLKFRRQVPFGPYVLDFLCKESRLVIELDGSQHALTQGYDTRRTAFLEANGFRVLRFWNNAVLEETSSVLETILRETQ